MKKKASSKREIKNRKQWSECTELIIFKPEENLLFKIENILSFHNFKKNFNFYIVRRMSLNQRSERFFFLHCVLFLCLVRWITTTITYCVLVLWIVANFIVFFFSLKYVKLENCTGCAVSARFWAQECSPIQAKPCIKF